MASPNVNIYTTTALGQNKHISQHFTSYGASGAPGPIAESRVSFFNNDPSAGMRMVLSYLWALIAAMVTGKPYNATGAYDLPASSSTFDIFPRPGLVITAPGGLPAAKRQALLNAGFAEQSNGRYKYWRGPSTDAAIRVAIQQGVTLDAYAPGNAASVNGIIAFSVINRLLHHTLRVLAKVSTELPSFSPKAVPVYGSLDDSPAFTEVNLNELPERGYFLAYFDGLLLPDQANSLRILGKLYGNLFGNGARKVETFKCFHSGWLSLNDTAAGKAISHMLFCVDTAVSMGVVLRPVYLNNEYAGCVLHSDRLGAIVGSTFVKPATHIELKDGIEIMMSHESALRKIVDLLNTLESDDENVDPPKVTFDGLLYARDIHDALRKRRLTNEVQQKLSLLFRKLRYGQTMWEVTNPRHVSAAVDLICREEFPPRDAPINLRLDVMWTRKPIYSVLGGFNVKAPSLRGDTGLSLALSRNMYSAVSKPGKLVGIPVFAKAHDKALEDWEGVIKDKQIWFAHKGADKFGMLKVKGRTLEVLLDTPEGKSIVASLALKALKRKRDEEEETVAEPTPEEQERQQAHKRRKIKGYGALGLNFDLGIQNTEGMDVDEPEDPFAV